MKPEEIEKRIADAPESKLPADWRSEILSSAEAARESVPDAAPNNTGLAWWIWRELLRPLRHGWSALAVLWVILLGAQLLTSLGGAVESDDARPQQALNRSLQVIEERRTLIAELLGSKDGENPDRKRAPMRPQGRAQSRHGSA